MNPLARSTASGIGCSSSSHYTPTGIHGRMGTCWVVSMVLLVGLAGCASPPPPPPPPKPQTVVILLPQSDAQGQPVRSAVQVQRGDASVTLDRPLQQAETHADGQWRQRDITLSEVQARYTELLRVQPPSPERFTLTFVTGKSQLTPESERLLPEVIRQAQARAGGEIVITGHTDRVGKADANDALSLRRAEAVAQILKEKGFNPDLISAIGRGEREPVVPTADEVAEPRNRRAEVLIR